MLPIHRLLPSRTLLASCAAVLLLHGPAWAWDIPGHMVVAQVAYHRLNTNALAHLEKLAGQLQFGTHNFNAVNIAAYADEIKNIGNQFRHWHFIDLGVPDSHLELLTNPPQMDPVNGDVVSALKLCRDVIKGQSSALIANEATAVALLVHFVGDIHQPLHCSAHYYTQENVDPGHVHPTTPEHDAGANAIKIVNFADTYTNLHSFWDKGYKAKRSIFYGATIKTETDLNTFQTSPNDPKITAWEQIVLASAPPASVDLKPDFEAWAKETHALGASEAYGKLSGNIEKTPRMLSYKYVKNARKIAQQRLCLAGFRLAELLNELYPEH